MQRFYRLLSGRSLRSLLGPLVLIGMLSLAGCGSNPLSLLTGSGPNVAANTQIGKENTQNLGLNLSKRPQIRVDAPVQDLMQDNSTTTNTTLDPLLIILLILGWLAPSPSEIARSIRDLFKK
jgi:hypothetical protein